MYILVLESSTTSAKALLYDTESGGCEERSRPYSAKYDDVSVQDAKDVFDETMKVGRELACGKEIACVALCGVWHSVMLCNQDMQPETPIYHWSYTGAAEMCKRLRADKDYVNTYYQKTGCMVNAIYPFFKLKLFAENGYDLTKYRIMGQGTYNNYRLTGQWVVTDVVVSGSGLLNIHAKTYDNDLLKELGITGSQLGRLITYKEPLTLCGQAAEMLGIKPGIPVVASMSDGSLNQIGAGAMREGIMTFSVGTSGALRVTSAKPLIPESPSTWCYLGPDVWLSGAATSGCCNCIDWFRTYMCNNEISYREMDEKAEEITVETPVFLPFLFGERCPGWDDERQSAFFNVRPEHTKFALYRAVLEGILFNLYQCYETVCALNGTPEKIRLSGGISKSPFWRQMCADIFGHEMEIDTISAASMLGGTVLARERLGLINDLREVEMPTNGTVVPNPETAEEYKRKYELYMKYYNQTKA